MDIARANEEVLDEEVFEIRFGLGVGFRLGLGFGLGVGFRLGLGLRWESNDRDNEDWGEGRLGGVDILQFFKTQ